MQMQLGWSPYRATCHSTCLPGPKLQCKVQLRVPHHSGGTGQSGCKHTVGFFLAQNTFTRTLMSRKKWSILLTATAISVASRVPVL
ncbi:hypothetical protein I79_007649 [Cricetulus griseus]|uniref:Uncharacterized protein n=1 Tax=Cricetulus griseus TaxID=10029 RepID=G3HB34_CRIGR|nr:hypothetical protein I79_007649 [Cricetulus griseus]